MVGDYISRDAAISKIRDEGVLGGDYDAYEREEDVVDTLNSIPAADAVEVRHASWIEDGYYNKPCVCSNCGEPCEDTVMGKPRWNYCPNCGAKMDGGQDDVM